MLTFLRILRTALLLAGAILAADTISAYLMTALKYAFIETFGDLVLVEVAALFILAGVIDFASSIGFAQFRKSYMSVEQGYSASKHKESERRALVLVAAGLILFVLLIVAALYEGF